MHTILRRPDISRYTISDHLEFHNLTYRLCDKFAIPYNYPALMPPYLAALTQETEVFEWVHKSEFTAKKAEADHARDHAEKGIEAVVRNDLTHFDPAVRVHAQHLHMLLETFKNPTRVDYDGETATIDSILTHLQSLAYAPDVQALGLTPWVNELHAQNELFKGYVDDASQQQTDKPKTTPRVARHATDEALRKITNLVTALVIFNGTDEYDGFVEDFNTLVNHYNTLVHERYGRIHTRIDIALGVIDPIAAQAYTGMPVFVLPNLTLVVKEKDGTEKTVTLEFTKDFTVSYENNVNVGMATLHVTGINKYVGTLTTTFNIAKQL